MAESFSYLFSELTKTHTIDGIIKNLIMKTIKLWLLIIGAIAFKNQGFSQIITETIDFNNYVSFEDNDLTHNFIFGLFAEPNFITQSSSGGITGGALIPPNIIDWGIDIITYCSTYKNITNVLSETSISFKYNSGLVNPNAFERAILIRLDSDTNDRNVQFYLDYSSTDTKLLRIVTYNEVLDAPVILQDGHWYNFVAQYQPLGGTFDDEVFVGIELFDLGVNGTSTPTSVGSLEEIIYDFYLFSSTENLISLSASKWGGAEYVDNFIFEGEKNRSICNTLNVVGSQLIDKTALYPNPTDNYLFIQGTTSHLSATVYNMLGKQVLFTNNTDKIDVSGLSDGVYIIKISDGVNEATRKFVKN